MGSIGRALAGLLARMRFDQLRSHEDPRQGAIGAYADSVTHEACGNGVECTLHLDVMIDVRFRFGPKWHIKRSGRCWMHVLALDKVVVLAWHASCRERSMTLQNSPEEWLMRVKNGNTEKVNMLAGLVVQ